MILIHLLGIIFIIVGCVTTAAISMSIKDEINYGTLDTQAFGMISILFLFSWFFIYCGVKLFQL